MRKRGWWLAVLLLLPCVVHAATFDLTAGPSVTAGDRTTLAVFASAFGNSPSSHLLRFEPIATLGWFHARHTHAHRLHRTVFVGGGGVRIDIARHWFASEQIVATSRRTDALSSRFEFASSAGWQAGHFMLMLRHISNAHWIGGGENMGETMLLAGVRW